MMAKIVILILSCDNLSFLINNFIFSVFFFGSFFGQKTSRPKQHTVKLVERLMISYDFSKMIKKLFWYLSDTITACIFSGFEGEN